MRVILSVKSHNSHLHGAAELMKGDKDQVLESGLPSVKMTAPTASLRNSDVRKAGPLWGFTPPATRPGTDGGLQNLVLPFKFFTGLQKTCSPP